VSRSYGIEVARLAGLPASVIARAREVLGELESERHAGERARAAQLTLGGAQLTLFEPRADAGEQEALAALRGIDPLATTPLAALALLARLHERLRGGEGN
jgi:DNA mismatch repair protein MutS